MVGWLGAPTGTLPIPLQADMPPWLYICLYASANLQVTATLPFACLQAAAYVCIIVGMCALRTAPIYVAQSCLLGILVSLIAQQVCLCV